MVWLGMGGGDDSWQPVVHLGSACGCCVSLCFGAALALDAF